MQQREEEEKSAISTQTQLNIRHSGMCVFV